MGRKGKGERWREGFGPPQNFGVAPPMDVVAYLSRLKNWL